MAFLNQVRAKSRAKLIQLSVRDLFLACRYLPPCCPHMAISLTESENPSTISNTYDSMDYAVHGIVQTRIPEWVAIPFSRGSSQPWESNLALLHCRQILYQLNHQGSPGILEWVAYPFSSRSSLSRNQTRVSCIARGFFTN